MPYFTAFQQEFGIRKLESFNSRMAVKSVAVLCLEAMLRDYLRDDPHITCDEFF